MLLPHRTDHRGKVKLGWRVHPKMTALDAFKCKGSENLVKCKTIL